MVDLQDIGRALAGFGAGVGGQGPQFLAGLAQQERDKKQDALKRDKARQTGLFQDARLAKFHLDRGDTPRAIQLFTNRIKDITSLGGDPSDTKGILDQLLSGDPVQLQAARDDLVAVDREGVIRGFLKEEKLTKADRDKIVDQKDMGAGRQQVTIQNKDGSFAVKIIRPTTADSIEIAAAQKKARDAKLSDEQRLIQSRADAKSANDKLDRGAEVKATKIFDDGTIVFAFKDGTSSTLQQSPENQEIIKKAIQAGADAQKLRAEGRGTGAVRGKETEARGQTIITEAIDAVKTVPTARRALKLMEDLVEAKKGTSGFDKIKLQMNQFVGRDIADATELSTVFGNAMLKQLKPTFGGSQITDAEREALADINAGFGKSIAANRRLMKRAIQIARNAAQRGVGAARARGDKEAEDTIRAGLRAQDVSDEDFTRFIRSGLTRPEDLSPQAPAAAQPAAAPGSAPQAGAPLVPGRALQSNALGREILLEEFQNSLREENAARAARGQSPLTEEQGKKMLGIQ